MPAKQKYLEYKEKVKEEFLKVFIEEKLIIINSLLLNDSKLLKL